MTAPARTLPPVLKKIKFPVIGSPLCRCGDRHVRGEQKVL